MSTRDVVSESRRAATTGLRVGIVGGGASGALTAARLLRDSTEPVHVVVFEPRPRLGQGIAYATTDPLHLLNVPACAMSALPEDPDHFRRWAGCEDTDFLPRSRYADYLLDVLDEASRVSPAGSRLAHVQLRVADAGASPTPWVLDANGTRHEFDVIVLATGNDLPQVLPGIPDDVVADPRFVADPWARDALGAIRTGDEVLVLGTGLTSVDVCLSILNRVKGARVQAVSRHGLVPLSHEDPWRPRHPAPDLDTDPVDLHRLIAYLRSGGEDWRRVVDSLRPLTNDLWTGMDAAARSAFLRHLSRYWDVHRHRMAPAIARAFGTLVDAGRVRIHHASVVGVALSGERLETVLDDGRTLLTDHVVMCTGPSGDLRKDPLGARLIARGTARPGPTGTGYLVEPATGALIDRAGRTSDRILTVGPPRKGVLWETTAMPEIRVQAADVARRVLTSAPATVQGRAST